MLKDNKILIKINNSSIGVYAQSSNNKEKKLAESSIHKEQSIEDIKNLLYKTILGLKKKYFNTSINLYTSYLNTQMDKEAWKEFVNEFYLTTGVFFHIVDTGTKSNN